MSITSASESFEDEQARRMRGYLIQMAIRTACFVGAFFVHGPLRWALFAGAVILPYTAVLFANAGSQRRSGGLTEVDRAALAARPDDLPPLEIGSGHRVLEHDDDRPAPAAPAPGTEGHRPRGHHADGDGPGGDGADEPDPPQTTPPPDPTEPR